MGARDTVGPGGRRLDEPDPSRLPSSHPFRAEILAAHHSALEHEEDGYLDPASGWWVFSAAHLLDRGTCCDNGCRHCPYL